MITGNKKPSLSPTDALDLICKICQSEYNKGKRKININKIWNIAYMGLVDNSDTSTKTFGLNDDQMSTFPIKE